MKHDELLTALWSIDTRLAGIQAVLRGLEGGTEAPGETPGDAVLTANGLVLLRPLVDVADEFRA